ncbi:MAG: flavodoxin-dependent (E)-4-hydroxy-3-methylbut-2-enyl-diphosphate synthase [Bacillota bacterium]
MSGPWRIPINDLRNPFKQEDDLVRRQTRPVRVGNLIIGGDAPIVVQSMTKTDTRDAKATIQQILELEAAGCELIRVAVPDREAADALPEIKRNIHIPLAADIHFDWRLAMAALDAGVDKLRLNPGNIGSEDRVRTVVAEAKARGVPIRIGVNAGSLEKDLLAKYGHPCPEAMVESAMDHVHILEDLGFYDTIISLKASDAPTTIAAYRLMAQQCDYPLHVGVTEAGTAWSGTIKSAIGIGALLADGIGDTIRVSLSAPSVEEIRVGFEILKSLELRQRGPNIISCPTCGRIEIDLVNIVNEVERQLADVTEPITVSILGCAVNGPGEAHEADIGVTGGRGGVAALYIDGKPAGRIQEGDIVEQVVSRVRAMAAENRRNR